MSIPPSCTFANLPAEIQVQIWKEAAAEPLLIHTYLDRLGYLLDPHSRKKWRAPVPGKLAGLVGACRLSRWIALEALRSGIMGITDVGEAPVPTDPFTVPHPRKEPEDTFMSKNRKLRKAMVLSRLDGIIKEANM